MKCVLSNYSDVSHDTDFVAVTICRTDAAVGPDGVVVLLRHTGITGEAVVCSHWLLCLRTKQFKTTWVCHGACGTVQSSIKVVC